MLWNFICALQLSVADVPTSNDVGDWNKDHLLSQLESNPNYFAEASELLRRDPDVIKKAVEEYPVNVSYVPEDVWGNRDLLFELMEINVAILRDLPSNLQHDKTVLRRAIQLDSLAVLMMPGEYRDDDVLMKMAVRNNPLVYKFISERLQENEYIVGLALADSKIEIWNEIPEHYREDIGFIYPRILNNCRLLEFYSPPEPMDASQAEFVEWRKLVFKCAQRDPKSFQFAPLEFRSDPYIISELLIDNPEIFQY